MPLNSRGGPLRLIFLEASRPASVKGTAGNAIDGDGIDRMAGRKGRAGKTQHGVVHVEPVFEPGLSARQPSDALGIGHVGHAMGDSRASGSRLYKTQMPIKKRDSFGIS